MSRYFHNTMFDPEDIQPLTFHVLVGGQMTPVNEFEWLASNMEKGTSVEWWKSTEQKWHHGVFNYAWFYDGVMADVSYWTHFDGDEQKTTLLLGVRDQMRVFQVEEPLDTKLE